MMNESGSENQSNMVFEILRPALGEASAARLGRLAIPRRSVMETPNFISLTSRGAIPHLAPDVLQRHVRPGGAYLALEDFVEKSHKTTPSILCIPTSRTVKALHAFTGLPLNTATVLAPRRAVAVRPPNGNGKSSMAIFTSTGFQNLTNKIYVDALASIQPDIAILMADLTYSGRPPVAKKQVRMAERTEDWLVEFFKEINSTDQTLEEIGTSIFAPVLPVEHSMQWEYLSRLEEEFADTISGLALTDVDVLPDIQNEYPSLAKLPRLSVSPLATPHQLLRQISLGVDLATIPFLNQVSDSGVAMTFTFPPPSSPSTILPLGTNMWDMHHQRSLLPLCEGCTCYACQTHHRAFIHHLLHAREMLAWVLLQVHNHHVLSTFFSSVRKTLGGTDGAQKWEELCGEFSKTYDPEFPEGTGERPRARGYNFKSQGGDSPINKKAWGNLEGGGDGVATDSVNTGGVNADVVEDPKVTVELVDRTVTETPLTPDPSMNANDLDERGIGFAETEKK